MHVHLVNLIKSRMGATPRSSAIVHFDDYNGQRVMVVECAPAPAPVISGRRRQRRAFLHPHRSLHHGAQAQRDAGVSGTAVRMGWLVL